MADLIGTASPALAPLLVRSATGALGLTGQAAPALLPLVVPTAQEIFDVELVSVATGAADSMSLPLKLTATITFDTTVLAVPTGVTQEPVYGLAETYPAPTLVNGRPS